MGMARLTRRATRPCADTVRRAWRSRGAFFHDRPIAAVKNATQTITKNADWIFPCLVPLL